ncbi:MAG: hypothetical protein H8E13_14950 [Actinobacteria bacterium]|nr:hypothetical protein [Actinomycetota bacterium]
MFFCWEVDVANILNLFNLIMKNKTIFYTILIFLLIGNIFMVSCDYGELGLSSDYEGTEEEEKESSGAPSEFSNEEFFLEMKSKQKDKNPLNDINIRRAIFYAIDRNKIVEVLLGDYGLVLDSLFGKNSDYNFTAWSQYYYDLDKAKEHLKMAGYSLSDPLYITIGTNEESESRKIIEELIKEDLEKVGINIWIFNKSSKDWYIDYVKNGNYELGVWALYTYDGENIENYFCSEKIPPLETNDNTYCNNFYWYNNTEFDAILRKFNREEDSEKKIELSKEFQDILAEDAVILPLYSRIFSIAYNNRIDGIKLNIEDGNFLENIGDWDIINGSGEADSKEVVVGYQHEPYVLNPFIHENSFKGYMSSLIIKGLWEVNKEGEYIPLLVEELSVDNTEDDIKHTLSANIKLKDDIYWQDGSPITAEDIRATWESVIGDESIAYDNSDYQNIKDIEIVNEKEFNIIFEQYFDNWKGLFTIIFPKDKLKGNQLSYLFENNIFGCGPYKIKNWVKEEYIILEKNEYYFGDEPEIDSIKFLFNSDINYLISLLKNGEVDILSIPADLSLMEELEEDEDINLLIEQGNLWEHLALCLKPR